MKRPPSPTDNSTTLPRRLKQSLTSLAPGISGAALLPVHGVLQRRKSWLAANKSIGTVKLVRISFCTSNFSFAFTHVTGHPSDKKPLARIGPEKCTSENDLKRAGAPPLFRLSAAQKVFGVAPARFGSQTRHAAGRKSQMPRTYRQRSGLIAWRSE